MVSVDRVSTIQPQRAARHRSPFHEVGQGLLRRRGGMFGCAGAFSRQAHVASEPAVVRTVDSRNQR